MSELNSLILKELSAKVSELIGYRLGEDHIHHIQEDGSGYYYYVQHLKPGYPVLLMHYRGPLVLMLPYADFLSLDKGETSVDQYIAGAHFSYGYFWGGGDMVGGGYWRPLEPEAGIHDRERISRYLNILSCRTNRYVSMPRCHDHAYSSDYTPDEATCRKCQLDETTCPFSRLNQTGDWDREVQEGDGRRELFKAISEMVQSELGPGFRLSDMMAHDRDRNEICLYPENRYYPDMIGVSVNVSLLNDLLYHPDRAYDWQQMVQDFTISIALLSETDMRVILPKNSKHKREICLELWRERIAEWEAYKESEAARNAKPETVDTSPEAHSGLGSIIVAFLGRFRKG